MGNNIRMIILIILDTLRPDHLGCYGYPLPTSPNIDQFAKDSVLYQYTFSCGSYTIPVHASILTGKLPSNHSLGFRQGNGHLNTDRDVTLAEILRSEGYRTVAIMSSYVLRKGVGLDAGFDVYDDHMTAHEVNRLGELIRDGKETNRVFFKVLEEDLFEKSFYFLHYFDIHGPYVKDLDKNYLTKEQYGNSAQMLEMVPNGFTGGIPEYQLLGVKKDDQGNIINYEKDARYYLSQYDKGIRYCDSLMWELFEFLKKKDLYDDSMIILTSDHGEALGENNIYFFHGLTVSLDQIRIPLIIKYPHSWHAGEIRNLPVCNVDIMPTLLDLINIDHTPFRLDGESLVSNHEENAPRLILSENQWQRAIIQRNYVLLSEKAITHSPFGYYFGPVFPLTNKRLYDYTNDPGCKKNLLGKVLETKKIIEFDSFLTKYVDAKEETIAEKDKQLEELCNHLKEKEMLLKQAQVLAKSVLSSWSWKITSPLRWLLRMITRG